MLSRHKMVSPKNGDGDARAGRPPSDATGYLESVIVYDNILNNSEKRSRLTQ